MITVLAGGIGAAKFLEGLVAVMPPEEITVIVNTGDDTQVHGLYVCPDIDTIIYTLTGLVDRERGWGIAGDTFHCQGALKCIEEDTWFQLGDQDIATHLYRTERLREGATLSEVTHELRQRLARRVNLAQSVPRILPMTNDPAPTYVRTAAGLIPFQEYFVKLRQEPEVLEVDLAAAGRRKTRAAPDVRASILEADGIIIAPSNPFISIGPILAVPGIRDALRNTPATVAAISPIIGGKALKGPADRMLTSLGHGSSSLSVAELYRDFVDVFVLDEQDAEFQGKVQSKGIKVIVTNTVMDSHAAKRMLSEAVLKGLRSQDEPRG